MNLSKKEWIAVLVGVVFVGYAVFGQTISNSFKQATTGQDNSAAVNNTLNQNIVVSEDNSGVKKVDITIGSGALVSSGYVVGVNYVLKLSDGTLIQDSKLVNNGEPFSFVSGAGQLIPGWELGIAGMRAGGKRVITIPPSLGYGANAVGPIPANSTLIFEIEVVSVSSLTQ